MVGFGGGFFSAFFFNSLSQICLVSSPECRQSFSSHYFCKNAPSLRMRVSYSKTPDSPTSSPVQPLPVRVIFGVHERYHCFSHYFPPHGKALAQLISRPSAPLSPTAEGWYPVQRITATLPLGYFIFSCFKINPMQINQII